MMRVRQAVFAAAGMIATVTVAAHGQARGRQRAEMLVTQAMSSAKAGDTNAAVSILREARKADDSYAPAHFQYGLMLARSSSMGFGDLFQRFDAVQAFNRALDLDKDNPWALLELGRLRLKMPFMRVSAEVLFERALRAAERRGDPEAVGEVNFEIGEIYDRRYRTMLNRHMFKSSTDYLDPLSVQYEKCYLEEFLEHSAMAMPDAGEIDAARAEGYYRSALTALPSHERAAASLATILYEARRFEEMARVSHTAALASPASARVRLAEGLALVKLQRYDKAAEVFESAVTLLTDRERQMIASIAPLMRPTDARSFEVLDDAARTAFERSYWDIADPLYLSKLNETRLSFMTRVAYSDLYFSNDDLSIRGALTDRGQIVLRYGEPPKIATFAPDVTRKEWAETMGRVTTLWYYPATDMRFVFVGPPAMTSAIFAGDFALYSDQLRADRPSRFDSLPGGLTVDTMPVQIGRFRGEGVLTTRVEFHAGIPTAALAGAAGLDKVDVEAGFMIIDGARRRVVDTRDTLRVPAEEKGYRTKLWQQQFRPGEYGYSVEAQEALAAKGARARGSISIGSFPTGAFAVSDILVGTDLGDNDLRRRSDLRMKVLPDNTLDPGQPLGLYWETYGAKPTAEGAVRLKFELGLKVLELTRAPSFHVRLMGGIADRVGATVEGEDVAGTLTFTRTLQAPPTADDRVLHSITVQLDGAPPAQYLLHLKVTDLESGLVATTSHVLYVRRP